MAVGQDDTVRLLGFGLSFGCDSPWLTKRQSCKRSCCTSYTPGENKTVTQSGEWLVCPSLTLPWGREMGLEWWQGRDALPLHGA